MPFDGVDFARHEKVLDKLDEVIGLLGSEDYWCQKALRTDDGRRCIVGANIGAVLGGVLRETNAAVEQALAGTTMADIVARIRPCPPMRKSRRVAGR